MPFDVGLLTPVSVGEDAVVSDRAVADALIEAEAALVSAWGEVGALERSDASDMAAQLRAHPGDAATLALAAKAGGNPVIPLVRALRDAADGKAARWIHRGATSQDILDTALMLVARAAGTEIVDHLTRTADSLAEFAERHRDEVCAARTLTQQAVPTTVGARAAGWLQAIDRARERLARAAENLPASLSGAGGTLAAAVETAGVDAASALPGAFAGALGLAAPEGSWHTTRWPVTELGDALVGVADALGLFAADVATLSRTEIDELHEGTTGGSSAMPQKQNPVSSVVIRSAAMRAPHLAATLHTAAALAVDERPDGAWHAEWPALRDLLRLALGAAATSADLAAGLRVNTDAVRKNLAITGGLIVSERLAVRLGDTIGAAELSTIMRRAQAGESLAALVTDALQRAGAPQDVDALLDPAGYIGLARSLTDRAVQHHRGADIVSVSLAMTDLGGPAEGPALVLGPSLGTSTILWSRVVPALTATHHVLAWDLPGHGASAPTRESFTVEDLADAVAAAAPDRFLYAGVSLGGATGLQLALRHPGRVRRAAIIASGALLGTEAGWRERAASVRVSGSASLVAASAQRWFARETPTRDPDIVGRLLHALRDADDDSYALCCEALAGYDVRAQLPEIEVPILALYGDEDEVAPEQKAREIAEGVRNGRLGAIDGAAHLPPAERPTDVVLALRAFFEERTTDE